MKKGFLFFKKKFNLITILWKSFFLIQLIVLFICEVYFYGIKLVTFVLILLSSSKASSVTHMFFLFCLIENNVCKCIYCCLNHIHIARRCLCIYINVENEMGLKVHVQR